MDFTVNCIHGVEQVAGALDSYPVATSSVCTISNFEYLLFPQFLILTVLVVTLLVCIFNFKSPWN